MSLLGSDDLMDHTPDERAQILARALARIRPELDLYLMTEIAVEDLAGRLSHQPRRRACSVPQDPRWKAEQLPSGEVRWITPSGRQYVTEPTRYPI